MERQFLIFFQKVFFSRNVFWGQKKPGNHPQLENGVTTAHHLCWGPTRTSSRTRSLVDVFPGSWVPPLQRTPLVLVWKVMCSEIYFEMCVERERERERKRKNEKEKERTRKKEKERERKGKNEKEKERESKRGRERKQERKGRRERTRTREGTVCA